MTATSASGRCQAACPVTHRRGRDRRRPSAGPRCAGSPPPFPLHRFSLHPAGAACRRALPPSPRLAIVAGRRRGRGPPVARPGGRGGGQPARGAPRGPPPTTRCSPPATASNFPRASRAPPPRRQRHHPPVPVGADARRARRGAPHAGGAGGVLSHQTALAYSYWDAAAAAPPVATLAARHLVPPVDAVCRDECAGWGTTRPHVWGGRAADDRCRHGRGVGGGGFGGRDVFPRLRAGELPGDGGEAGAGGAPRDGAADGAPLPGGPRVRGAAGGGGLPCP